MEEQIKTTNPLSGRRIAILVEDGFEEIELTSPKDALVLAGASVDLVSPKTDKVRSKTGDDWNQEFTVDVTLNQASVNDYDALLLPGGVINPDKMRTNSDALDFVKAFSQAQKPIAAICHGPQVLISAQLIDNRKMTSIEAIKQDLINAGADWQDEEVVEDRGLVTSRKPDDLPAFNKRIVEVFARRKSEES